MDSLVDRDRSGSAHIIASAWRQSGIGGHRAFEATASDPLAVWVQLIAPVEMGFAVATFPWFQGLDDMRLFVVQVMPHFSKIFLVA